MSNKKTPTEEAQLALIHRWQTVKQAVHPQDWEKAHPTKLAATPDIKPEEPKPAANTEAGQPTVTIIPAEETIDDNDQPGPDTPKP